MSMKWIEVSKAKLEIMEPVLVKDAENNWSVGRLEQILTTKDGIERTFDCLAFDGAKKLTNVTHVAIIK